MCRLIVFSGTCTRCGDAQTWLDLSQELSCLEAKNEGTFGDCSRGINIDERDFDQECDRCADEDEGIGDLDDEISMGLGYELYHNVDDDSVLGKRPIDPDLDEHENEDGRRKKQKTEGSSLEAAALVLGKRLIDIDIDENGDGRRKKQKTETSSLEAAKNDTWAVTAS